MDKELFRKTEGILYDYNDLTNKIELLKAEIKEMEEQYQGCSAIQYEEKTGSTNKFNSSVENEVMSREQKLICYYKDLNKKQTLKRRLDIAIESLKEEEKQLVELRYTNKRTLSWNQIARALKYSVDYCRKDLRNRIIRKLADTIFYNPYKQERFEL
ncbi:DUF722 domain-containing protein [uncultured Clostridium sp.]|jgi:DNA-directed RNA polymerase specialized sigma subunit|uniref:DUF722 domain-containing protein n=1 Tax=uncultured Clostridium sp. TaxID=59620 RepID=UPI0025FD7059|nr:DUF722 domain-containing protein [uncultured Clostridium sp.]